MEYSRHEVAALAGVKVTVRRYIQPTLKAGDPDREQAGEHAGTVTHVDGAGRLVLDSCPEAIWPEPAFLGGSPQHGTSRWLVTEITRDGEEGGLAMTDLNAGEHDEDSRVKARTDPDITEWVPVETQDITGRIRVDHGGLHLDRLMWAYLSAAQWEALKAEGDRLMAGAQGRKALALATEAIGMAWFAGQVDAMFPDPEKAPGVDRMTDADWAHIARVLRDLPGAYPLVQSWWDAAGKELSGGQ